MILIDTSVWVDHFRYEDEHLSSLLIERQVLVHPIVVGQLACGNLKDRSLTLRRLDQLPRAERLNDEAVRIFYRTTLGVRARYRLFGYAFTGLRTHRTSSRSVV